MKKPANKNLRAITVIIFAVFAIAIGGLYYNINANGKKKNYELLARNIKIDGTVLPKARFIQAFKLSNNGKAFTKTQLQGHWTMLFFGFTNCGYVCPTTLSALNKMYINLKAELSPNLLPHVIMVTVDRKRDSYQRINEYVRSFNPAFVGMRGTAAETKALANQMSVIFTTIKSPTGNYTISHSASIMLLDPNGNLRAFLSYPHHATQMAKDYKIIIKTLNSQYQ